MKKRRKVIGGLIMVALLIIAAACGDGEAGRPTTPIPPSPTATPSSSLPLGPTSETPAPLIITEAQAIEVATQEATSPSPRVTGVRNIRNLQARLMTLGEYEKQFGSGQCYPDCNLPVWVIAMEGESELVEPAPTPTVFHYAVVVLSAQTGQVMRVSLLFNPIPLEKAEGLDPTLFPTLTTFPTPITTDRPDA